jgi:hypothetical protein
VLVGIPGPTSFPGFVKRLAWWNPFHFKYLFAPRAVLQGYGALRASRHLEFERVVALDAAFREYLASRGTDAAVVALAVSPEFLEWRVLGNRSYDYSLVAVREAHRMVGFIVYRAADRGRVFIEMVDFLSPEYWTPPRLLAAMRYVVKETRATFAYTWEPTREDLYRAYRLAGFVKNPWSAGPFSYATPFIVRSPNPVCRGIDLRNRASYDLQPLMED